MTLSMKSRHCVLLALGAAGMMLLVGSANAQYTPVWFDGYEATPGFDINADLGAPRQGGSPIPLAYDANTATGVAQADDYHQQIIGPDGNGNHLLQLAGDVGINEPPTHIPTNTQIFHSYASPDHNFKGVVGGEVIGKKISVTIDAFTNSGDYDPGDPNVGGDGYFTTAAITIGSTAKITDSDNLTTSGVGGFSVKFLEQTFVDALWTDPNVGINFLQFRDDQMTDSIPAPAPDNTVGNLIPHSAGTGPAFVEIFIDDPNDGNPWDGIGQTDIEVHVNGENVFNYSKLGGGFTDNYITLQAMNQSNVSLPSTLAVHTFDDLTVYSAPIPEPTSFVLMGMGLCSLAIRRRGPC